MAMTMAASGTIAEIFFASCRYFDKMRTNANKVTKKTRKIDMFSSAMIFIAL
jgi:hypothetical protein